MYRCYLFIVYCLVSAAVAGCSKNINASNSITSGSTSEVPNVNGSWELRSWHGGKTVNNHGESEPGNGNVYTFTGTHFEHFENHNLLDSGTYALTKSRGPENAEPLTAFVFNHTDTLLFRISGDTLVLDPRAPMYDGIAKTYVRVYTN